MVICTIFNIGLIIATSSKSGELKKMSENYEYQSGQKIFQDIDASELGSAYYDERYKKSNTLVAWMHEKYKKLESSLELLSEQFMKEILNMRKHGKPKRTVKVRSMNG